MTIYLNIFTPNYKVLQIETYRFDASIHLRQILIIFPDMYGHLNVFLENIYKST